MSLKFSEFTLERATFELRYPEALLLWDHAGGIWHSLRRRFPKIKPRIAQPNTQQILVQDNVLVEARLARLNITANGLANKTDEFGAVCDDISTQFLSVMEITDLERIGFRMFFEKKFTSGVECSDYLVDSFPAFTRTGKFFNLEGNIRDPELGLRWEGPAAGFLVKVYNAEQKLEVDIPFEFREADLRIQPRNLVTIDVDCYVHANTAVSKYNAKALIEGWTRAVRRDLEAFINA